MSKENELRDKEWNDLYKRIIQTLRQYGKDEATGDGDYWVVDDNYGWQRLIVNVFNLKMLNPSIILALRALLSELPNWSIVLALDVPGTEGKWPPMGVTIRKHEIIDGLERDYLPEPYRALSIPGSKPGTGFD
jgi:hypothetical protein